MTESKTMGTTTFLKRAGISGPVMRGLEAANVIKPNKSDSGWRMFGETDVRAVLKWKAAKKNKTTA